MFFNQELKVARTAALACVALAAVACSHLHSRSAAGASASAPPEGVTDAGAAAAPAPQLTATEAAANAADAGAAAPAAAPAPAPAPTAEVVNPSAPKQYTVKHGDTLWGIASLFLRDPWLWPEIWYVNPQVKNPHLIFPGDVLALAYAANGRPQVRLVQGGAARFEASLEGGARLEPQLRSEAISAAIPTIPYAQIAAFLTRPTALPWEVVKRSPYVVAFREDHKAGGTGHEAYVRGMKSAPQGARFSVMHVEDKLRDPDHHRTLGYAGVYTATAIVEQSGDPAKVLLLDSAQETLVGDILLADESAVPLTFTPHPAPAGVRGRILWVDGAVQMIGRFNVIAISRGKRQGVDAGTVLTVDQVGDVVEDRGAAGYETSRKPQVWTRGVRLPEERAGTIMVFKAYDQVSYALVVSALSDIRIADVVRTP